MENDKTEIVITETDSFEELQQYYTDLWKKPEYDDVKAWVSEQPGKFLYFLVALEGQKGIHLAAHFSQSDNTLTEAEQSFTFNAIERKWKR